MTPKYVFLDVDGTLVNFKGEIPESAVRAMKLAQNNGHKMILATGRQKSQIYSFLTDAIRFDGFLASSSAYIELDGKTVFESRPTKEGLAFMIDFFEEHHIPYFLQSTNMLYATKDCYERILAHMRAVGNGERLLESIFKNTELVENPKSLTCVEKAAYYESPFSLEEIRERLGDYYCVVSYSLGGKHSLYHGEITFEGVNKATGITRFMEAAGAPIYDSIAIGDSGNDLDMIKAAGIGVAMGNASEDIKAAADLVTRHIDDNGIYAAFEALGLI